MLSRPNVGIRAQYTAVCFLNQFELSRSDEDKALARRLVDMYFQCFETVVKSDTEVASKLLSALLSVRAGSWNWVRAPSRINPGALSL